MNNRFFFILIPVFLVAHTVFGQFSPEKQARYDSLVNILQSSKSHDTTLASASAYLAGLLSVTHTDTMIHLAKQSLEIIDENLQKDLPANLEKSFLVSRGQAYNNMGYYYNRKGMVDSALFYYKKALSIKEKTGDKEGLAVTLNNIGYILENRGRIKEGLKYYKKSLRIRKEIGDQAGTAQAANNIGMVYKNQGLYSLALEYMYQSLEIQEKIDHKRGWGIVLSNIGLIYKNLEEYEKALEHYNKSLDLLKEAGDKRGMGITYNNIGFVFRMQKKYDKALEYYKKGLEMRKVTGDKRGMSFSYSNLANLRTLKKDFKAALDYYFKALELRKEIDYKDGIGKTLFNIAGVYHKQGDLRNALKYGLKGEALASKLNSLELQKASGETLEGIYRDMGQYDKAYRHYTNFIEMRDSIMNLENQEEAIKREVQYDYQKKAQADSIRAAEAKKVIQARVEAQEAKIKKDRMQRNFLYGGLGLLLLFGGFMYNRFRVTTRQKQVIEIQKTEVEAQKEVVEAKNHEILDSINYAKRLQEAILPPLKLVKQWMDQSFILYKPKDIVAGDFYWFDSVKASSNNDENTLFFAAADCTGHGVPGAMVSVICSNALSKAVIEENLREPGKILDRTRELVIDRFGKSETEIQDGMDIALCSLNTHTHTLNYSGAHNPLWIIRKETGTEEKIKVELTGEPSERIKVNVFDKFSFIEVKADKQPIGKYASSKPFTTHKLQLKKDDAVYIFSDGFPDQFGGEKGKKYKSGRFKKFLLSIQNMDMQKQRTTINKEFEDWKGNLEQIDDVCVIGVKV